jgi:hypothetical protein
MRSTLIPSTLHALGHSQVVCFLSNTLLRSAVASTVRSLIRHLLSVAIVVLCVPLSGPKRALPSRMKVSITKTLSVGAAFACIAFAARISSDYDRTVDFAQYMKYSWMKVQAGNSLWEDRIVHAVDAQLAAKGWTKVDSGGDAYITAFGSTKDQRTLDTFYNAFGGGWRWRRFGDGSATTTEEITTVGTLVVDVFDSRTKKLVWRGSSSATLSSKPPRNAKKLQDDLRNMFKEFPSQPR